MPIPDGAAACVTVIVLVIPPPITVTAPLLGLVPVLAEADIVNEPLPVRLAGVMLEIVSHDWLLERVFHVVLEVTETDVFEAAEVGDHVSGLIISVDVAGHVREMT